MNIGFDAIHHELVTHVNNVQGWPKNRTIKFVRADLSKTLAQNRQFGTALAATFINISAKKLHRYVV